MFSIDLVEEKIKSLENQKNELDDQISSLKNYQIELLKNTIKDVWVVYQMPWYDKYTNVNIRYFLNEEEAEKFALNLSKDPGEAYMDGKKLPPNTFDYKKYSGKMDDLTLYLLYKKGRANVTF